MFTRSELGLAGRRCVLRWEVVVRRVQLEGGRGGGRSGEGVTPLEVMGMEARIT